MNIEYAIFYGTVFFFFLFIAFELSFSMRKEFSKKKVSGEIAFALISVIHVQIQLPASRSTTAKAFVFLANFALFSYCKIFETRSQ